MQLEGMNINRVDWEPTQNKDQYVHYYQFNIGDYASHTARLSPMEDLAYRRLLDLYYLNEKPFTGTVEDIAREIGLNTCLTDVEYVLNKYFSLDGETWSHKRAELEIAEYQRKRKSRQKAGKASGKARQVKASEQVLNNVELTNNHKPLTKNQEPVKKTSPRFTRPSVDEIRAYCLERKNTIDPESFFAHYEANGWVQGKGKPIKNWKMAVITWEKQRSENTQRPGQHQNTRRLSAGDRVRARAAERAGQPDRPHTPALGSDG